MNGLSYKEVKVDETLVQFGLALSFGVVQKLLSPPFDPVSGRALLIRVFPVQTREQYACLPGPALGLFESLFDGLLCGPFGLLDHLIN